MRTKHDLSVTVLSQVVSVSDTDGFVSVRLQNGTSSEAQTAVSTNEIIVLIFLQITIGVSHEKVIGDIDGVR